MTRNSEDAVEKVLRQVNAPEQNWESVLADGAVMTKQQLQEAVDKGTTDGVEVDGRPIVIVYALGAKSGELKRFPVMRVEHDGRYAIVASLGGAPQNPAWYYNVRANPKVELQDGSVTLAYTAIETDGARRDEWWERAVAAYPSYAVYQSHCPRLIPVFELTRSDD